MISVGSVVIPSLLRWGTREAILALKIHYIREVLGEKLTYMTFIDLENAFKNIDWRKPFAMVRNIKLKYK